MKSEAYIKKIIEETGLTKKEIEDRVKAKKEELKGLISEDGALFIIAKELGVNVKKENNALLKEIDLNTSDITQNMKNITIAGRVKQINQTYEFDKKDGSKGKVGSFILSDKAGDIRVVLWDKDTELLESNNFDLNEVVKVVNAYAKMGKYGIEIHIGRLGKIILSPEDVNYKKFPKIKDEKLHIDQIDISQSSVSIEGKIIQKFPINEFQRKDGSTGRVASIVLLDETGSIRVTFWDDDTEELNDLEIGNIVLIKRLQPKRSSLDASQIDVYFSSTSKITKIEKEIEIEQEVVPNIKELQNRKGVVSIKGIISSIDDLKRVNLKSGDEVSLLGFTISDETDGIRATMWRDLADKYVDILNSGDGVELKQVLIKYSNFSGRNEISFIKDSKIEKIDMKIENLKPLKQAKKTNRGNFTGNFTKINSIKSDGFYELQGFIAKGVTRIIVYTACKNCFKKVENCTCDTKGETEKRMILNVTLDDESDTMRATFIGDKAEELIGQDTETIDEVKDTPDFNEILENINQNLLGRDVKVKGKVKYSDFSQSYEIIVYEIQDIEINEELERVMNEIET